jgi:hypothetical protein
MSRPKFFDRKKIRSLIENAVSQRNTKLTNDDGQTEQQRINALDKIMCNLGLG